MAENEPIRFPGTMGPYTGAAVNAMKDGKPGDTFTREAMSKVVGRDCSPGGTGIGNVYASIRHCESFFRICWRWNKSLQAWLCQDDAGKVEVLGNAVASARRKVRRGMKVASSVDRTKLTAEQSRDVNVKMASAGMMDLCSSSGFQKKLELTDEDVKQPDVAKITDLMTN